MEKELFSVVIIHYRQPEYYKEAVDSVISQNYPAVEIIFADDGSDNVDIKEVEKYIGENAGSNIAGYKVFTNSPNVGTVKNMNKAANLATGKYLLFFAADDRMADENVLSNFAKTFEGMQEKNDDRMLVCAQSVMLDEKLEEKLYDYVDETSRMMKSSAEQHKRLLYKCCYAMGATAFIREKFLANGGFNEVYKVIEDWSFFLNYTRNKNSIHYENFDALHHRAGGISENGKEQKLLDIFKKDLNSIFKNEVLPYLSEVDDVHSRAEMLMRYRNETGENKVFLKYLLLNPAVFWYLLKGKIRREKLF